MPNALAYTLTSLTFAGTDLQRSDLTVHLEVSRGLDENPAMRGQDTVVPHLVGRIDRAWLADTLDIELSGFVQGTGSTESDRRASFRTLAEEMKTVFTGGGSSTLEGLGPDGFTYTIQAKPLSDPLRWGPQDIPGYRELTVLLVALQPFWTPSGGGS